MKANHSNQSLDILKISPVELKKHCLKLKPLSITCVLTGILLDKPTPEVLETVTVTLW